MTETIMISALLMGSSALDPVSVLLMRDTAQVIESSMEVHSVTQSVNLDGPEFGYFGYSNQVISHLEQNKADIYIGLVDQQQGYFYQLDQENYDLAVQQTLPFFILKSQSHQVSISPQSWQLSSGIFLKEASLSASFGYQKTALDVDVDSEKFDIAQQLDFSFERQRCGVAGKRRQWQLSLNCAWSNENLQMTGTSAQFIGDQWQFTVSYLDNLFNASDVWQVDSGMNGDTEVNLQQQALDIAVKYQNWQLNYLYRTVDGDMVTDLEVQDELIVGVGKGRYMVTGQLDFQQHLMTLEPPSWRGRWGQITLPLSVTYIDNINVKAEVYEPLLFFGLPVLTDTQQLNIRSAALTLAQIQWTYVGPHWQLTGEANQLVPISIEKRVSDTGGGDGGGTGGGAGEPAQEEDNGLFWPGFSLRLGIGWRY